jgi:tetratricopeptide (TPR) repeat protein
VSRSIVHVRRKKKDTDPLRSAWHILEDWMEVNRRRILTIAGVAVGLAAAFGLAYYFLDYREERRLEAFSAAFDKFTATVGAQPAPTPGLPSKKVNFPDEQTKYAESAAAFERLADDYSSYRDIGRYYAGVSYLHTAEADKGVRLLEEIAGGGSESRYEARLALAEHFEKVGAFDRAEEYYQKLADDPGKLPRFYVLNQLASVKERLGKPAEAAPLYKLVVDADRNGAFGAEAEKGLQRVDPAAAAALPPKAAMGPGQNPSRSVQMPGGSPFGMQ